mgnify:CR=1 FL=1
MPKSLAAFVLICLSVLLHLACSDQHVSVDTRVDSAATTASDARQAESSNDASVVADAHEGSDRVVRILPLGDSLTVGFGTAAEGPGTEGGYRRRLARLLNEAGVFFDFVGSQTNGPAALGDKDHEGYNGYAVAQVAQKAIPALETYQPDLILLLAGSNDQITFVPPTQPPEDAAADLEQLIEQLDRESPGVQIIVGKVVPLVHNDSGVRRYNELLEPLFERQIERGVRLQLVDMYAIGEANLAIDGMHPTQAGYDMMADIWFPAVMAAVAGGRYSQDK